MVTGPLVFWIPKAESCSESYKLILVVKVFQLNFPFLHSSKDIFHTHFIYHSHCSLYLTSVILSDVNQGDFITSSIEHFFNLHSSVSPKHLFMSREIKDGLFIPYKYLYVKYTFKHVSIVFFLLHVSVFTKG